MGGVRSEEGRGGERRDGKKRYQVEVREKEGGR